MFAEIVLYLLILLLTCVSKKLFFTKKKRKRFVKIDYKGLYVYICCL